ncbi:hypothetical protein HQ865_06955 [Mucilaginibacter mali]|uniref:Carboxypeptidase regulatory-like domain-containing protein n=1 Tax=Mucilaginibacter mali TaxID=2740462 RepID=A0A7D4PT99_9SPHI|nr:hypothetical protein [Mucilaginibacter mali]QKJ29503.1 hypothetical protein HQ865_06955 [Mucilaginibacter mali]
MKKVVYFLMIVLIAAASCKKTKGVDSTPSTDLQKAYADNSAKVTISNGVWGTVSTIQGNCMPTTDPKTSTCTSFVIQREVRIYAYTKNTNATPTTPLGGLYDNFSTQLIKTINTDAQGFYQAQLPDGAYTVVFVESGKLYANSGDSQGGISPVTVSQNKANLNLILNRAAY